MICFGSVPAGAVLPIMFTTYASATGASVTMSGLAVTDIEVYKGTSMTQRASDAGYTLLDTDGIDIDSVTGLHGFSIDLGDNTDSGFYAAGSFYTVVVSAVTVDSQAVTFIAATFRIAAAESSAGVPKVDVSHFGGTAATTSGGRPEVNTTHAAGTAWGSGAITAASIADGAIDAATFAAGAIDAAALAADAGTEIATAVWASATRSLTVLDEDSTTLDLDATIRAAVGLASANLDTQLSTIDGVVDAILLDTAEIGAAGAGLTALASAANLATVAGYLDTEIAAILADTNELQTDWANGGRLDLLIDAIKAKTDSLTFTIANVVDANVQRINDVVITGDGQPGTEFGV